MRNPSAAKRNVPKSSKLVDKFQCRDNSWSYVYECYDTDAVNELRKEAERNGNRFKVFGSENLTCIVTIPPIA